MTRGTGYIITEDALIYHDEFNGDMYWDGWGEEFAKLIHSANRENLCDKVMEFNKEHHNYLDFECGYKTPINMHKWFYTKNDRIVIDFVDYFGYWFSDYTFIKNDTKQTVYVITNQEVEYDEEDNPIRTKSFVVELNPGDTGVFYFGEVHENSLIIRKNSKIKKLTGGSYEPTTEKLLG